MRNFRAASLYCSVRLYCSVLLVAGVRCFPESRKKSLIWAWLLFFFGGRFRLCVQYEDAEDASEVPQQSAPPPPANNASTFPALGSAAGISAAEPVPVASHNASKVPSQSGPQQPPPSDPAVLQMGPTAVPHNNPAGTVSSAVSSNQSREVLRYGYCDGHILCSCHRLQSETLFPWRNVLVYL